MCFCAYRYYSTAFARLHTLPTYSYHKRWLYICFLYTPSRCPFQNAHGESRVRVHTSVTEPIFVYTHTHLVRATLLAYLKTHKYREGVQLFLKLVKAVEERNKAREQRGGGGGGEGREGCGGGGVLRQSCHDALQCCAHLGACVSGCCCVFGLFCSLLVL